MRPLLAGIKQADGPIPDLRPPKGKIPVEVPEAAVMIGTLVVAFGSLILGRLLRRGRAPVALAPELPAALARRELGAVQPDDAPDECARILRAYLSAAWQVQLVGATTSEVCSQLGSHPLADSELISALARYFGESEIARFAQQGSPEYAARCIAEGYQLIDALEARRSQGPHSATVGEA